MCFSPSVSHVDTKKKYFCSGCTMKLGVKGIRVE
jgi:predicted Zn-dependent protease